MERLPTPIPSQVSAAVLKHYPEHDHTSYESSTKDSARASTGDCSDLNNDSNNEDGRVDQDCVLAAETERWR